MTTMNLNANLNGIELHFDEKPADAVREAMKALGFRWHAKKSIWWAKQTDARLALAQELCNADKPAKGKGKKAAKKSAPKADEDAQMDAFIDSLPSGTSTKHPTLAEEIGIAPAPKADAPKAPKAPKAKAEPKAKKPAEVKLSELSDKLTYYVATAKGFETRKGYTFTASVGKTSVELAVCKEKDGTWTVTECTTGIAVAGDFEKRYLALKGVDAKMVKEVAKLLKADEYAKRAKALEKHIKKASK